MYKIRKGRWGGLISIVSCEIHSKASFVTISSNAVVLIIFVIFLSILGLGREDQPKDWTDMGLILD